MAVSDDLHMQLYAFVKQAEMKLWLVSHKAKMNSGYPAGWILKKINPISVLLHDAVYDGHFHYWTKIKVGGKYYNGAYSFDVKNGAASLTMWPASESYNRSLRNNPGIFKYHHNYIIYIYGKLDHSKLAK